MTGLMKSARTVLKLHWLVGMGFCLVIFSGPAAADTVYSTYGPGYATFPQGAGVGSYIYSSYDVMWGMAFTPSATFNLSQIDVTLFAGVGSPGATIELRSDSSGSPGAVLESWNFVDLPAYDTSYIAPLSAASTLDPLLLQGTQYWLVARATDPSLGSYAWSISLSSGNPGFLTMANNVGGSEWEAAGPGPEAFDILGTSVPEPGSLILLGAGLLGLVFIGRSRFGRPKA